MFNKRPTWARVLILVAVGACGTTACGDSGTEFSESVSDTGNTDQAQETPLSGRASALPKVGLLDCPADGAISTTSATLAGDAFDDPEKTARTPEGALELALEEKRQSKNPSGRRIAEFPYKKSTDPSASSSRDVHFVGLREDGTVQVAITVTQGGKSKSWIPTGMESCSALRSPLVGAPGTYDKDDGGDEPGTAAP